MRRHYRLMIASIPLLVLLAVLSTGTVTAGGGCHGGEGTMATEASATVVKIDGCTFAPAVTRVPVGTEVTFLNTSMAPHDVTGRNHEWGTPTLNVGASFAARFTKAGVFPYSCSLHPGMAGVVIIGSPVSAAAAAEATDAPDTAAVAATAPAATGLGGSDPTLAIASAGGVGLLAGLGFGAAVVARRRRPV
jgi:plastocyanin